VPEPTLTFKCLGHVERDDNSIECYKIEVTDSRNGRLEMLQVAPRHLVSARSMKRILLERCMFYSAKQKQHTQNLMEMFDPTPELD